MSPWHKLKKVTFKPTETKFESIILFLNINNIQAKYIIMIEKIIG